MQDIEDKLECTRLEYYEFIFDSHVLMEQTAVAEEVLGLGGRYSNR